MVSLNGGLSLNVLFTITVFIMIEIYFNLTSDRTEIVESKLIWQMEEWMECSKLKEESMGEGPLQTKDL